METAPRDFDAMTGRVITRGLEGLMFQCVLNTDHKRIYDVYEGGKGTPKLWTLTLERYENPTPHMTDKVTKALRSRKVEFDGKAATEALRRGLRPDRRRKPRP